MKHSIITGVGHYVPEKVITNHDLSKLMDTSDEWIRERTGIVERRYFDHTKDTVANMGAKASRMALERAGVDVKEVDFIVFATITPDYFFPGSGVLMQRELGLEGIGALDIRNACSGFIYGLSIADQYIKTGMYKTILVVGSEIQSSGIELTDRGRNVAVIFGDGAGAAVVQASDDQGRGILSTHLHADGRYAEELYGKDPGSSRKERLTHDMIESESIRPYMNGNAVFKHAVVRFSEVIMEAMQANNLQKEDISLLIPHQANLRISSFIQQKLKLADEKIYNNIQRYGNTTGASIPLAWSEAWAEGKVKSGDLICLAAFGSGFTWASALVRW
jgi:3-oxoacyl-[acyl-carrier-protein] synthase III